MQIVFNCKIVSSVLESVNYDFTISSHSPLSPFPGNAHFQHYFSSLSTPTVVFFYLTSQPHKPPFSLAPPGGNILPPHLTPFLHTVSQLLTSSSFHAHGAPLTSQQLVETGQLCGVREEREENAEAPAPTPSHNPSSSRTMLELLHFLWISVLPTREMHLSSPSPKFIHTELAFSVHF